MRYDWYETWVDKSPIVPSVLFVFPAPNCTGGVLIVDLQESDNIVHKAHNYEDAKMWLLEDEFIRIEGRMTA